MTDGIMDTATGVARWARLRPVLALGGAGLGVLGAVLLAEELLDGLLLGGRDPHLDEVLAAIAVTAVGAVALAAAAVLRPEGRRLGTGFAVLAALVAVLAAAGAVGSGLALGTGAVGAAVVGAGLLLVTLAAAALLAGAVDRRPALALGAVGGAALAGVAVLAALVAAVATGAEVPAWVGMLDD